MLPIGPLMIEHRLIERMIKLIATQAVKIKNGQSPDIEFIRLAVDFIKTYADRLHHGKEENILFRDLSQKTLADEHNKIMSELVDEHVLGRNTVKKLVEAMNKYLQGDKKSANVIGDTLQILADFYPKHIEKEDKRFFLPSMNYFSKEEQAAMLNEFNEFDRKFIHLHYQEVVSELDGKKTR
jgi:hemerythrin-like domain-containing protein